MDFYYINKKRYDIDAIFDENGGKYGKYNVKTLAAYFVGIVVQIPFLTNSFFTGTFANIIPDVDISWIVGMLVTAVIYYLFNQSKVSARHYDVSTKKC
jgi:NCS1 family nucleobase:cation symporter-1